MIWSDLFAALALFLVFEGLLPFVSPDNWRRSISLLLQLNDNQMRMFGGASILVGLFLLLFIRGLG